MKWFKKKPKKCNVDMLTDAYFKEHPTVACLVLLNPKNDELTMEVLKTQLVKFYEEFTAARRSRLN